MKNRKGFTLIEIMIVIAIIGILALVLIPKISSMKNQAKLAGVDTNMRVAEGIIQSMINRYDSSDDSMVALEADIAKKLPTDVENPFTGDKIGTGAMVADATAAAGTTLPYGHLAAATAARVGKPNLSTVTGNAYKGTIIYAAYKTSGGTDVNVLLQPYDEIGALMAEKIITK